MSNLLFYWAKNNYKKDVKNGITFHLNQNNPLMHKIEIGENLWAITYINKRYVLSAHLIAFERTVNSVIFKYGRYRVWGHPEGTRYFDIEGQSNSIETIIREGLEKKDIKNLSLMFQGNNGVKEISEELNKELFRYSEKLDVLHQPAIYPEDIIESRQVFEYIENIDIDTLISKNEKDRKYLQLMKVNRNNTPTKEMQELYSGKCQLCGWSGLFEKPGNLCHVHHIQWICRGGTNDIENLMLLCPNCHTAAHRYNAVFDYGTGEMCFENLRLPLKLNSHLK